MCYAYSYQDDAYFSITNVVHSLNNISWLFFHFLNVNINQIMIKSDLIIEATIDTESV